MTHQCATCGDDFEEFNERYPTEGPVSVVEEFTCPNGHTGKINYDSSGQMAINGHHLQHGTMKTLKLAGNAITATLTSWSVGFAALGWSYLRAALLPLLLWTLIIVYIAGERRGETRMAEQLTNGEHES